MTQRIEIVISLILLAGCVRTVQVPRAPTAAEQDAAVVDAILPVSNEPFVFAATKVVKNDCNIPPNRLINHPHLYSSGCRWMANLTGERGPG